MVKLLLATVLVLALCFQLAAGWFATGHMLTAQIAWKYLNQPGAASPATLTALQNAVTSLLTYTNDSNTFVTAAVWMDDLKFRDLNQYDNWHYINFPICDWGGPITDNCNGTSIEDILGNEDEEDVIWAIYQAVKTLRSSVALGYERGFALRNLLHLVGDVHQPLHVGNRFSVNTPNGDLGGNLFKINDTTWRNNLHSLWDSGVGMLDNNINRPLNASDAAYLSDMADQIMNRTAALVASVGNTTNVTAWAMESYSLAISNCYNISWWGTPDADYIATNWEVVQDRLGLGGYRLALLLKQIYLCGYDNCPEPYNNTIHYNNTVYVDRDTAPKDFKIGFLVLAGVLGLSLILNIVQCVRSRRAAYEPVNSTY